MGPQPNGVSLEVVTPSRNGGFSEFGDQSAVAEEGGDGNRDHQEEAAGGEEHRATEAVPRVTEETGAVGPSAEPVNSDIVAEERSSTVEGNSGEASGSGAASDNSGPSRSPPRDSAKGKGIVTEEEETTEIPIPFRKDDVAFRPAASAATSSSHVRVTKNDIAEHLLDEMLAKLLEDIPMIGEVVLKAKEERARAIVASDAAEWAERERAGEAQGLAADVEAEEREAEEAQGPRVRAVDEAGTMTRPEFSEEAYMPPRPHLFVPSGFAGFKL
ncbi:hypothetical protein RHMOL_Rhmol04G0217400 [Rhododendron molle]|uniref:Uncharacterized protein n=1 Tax=Rhododendron molle TaxID=49168 RepID=A0ACC0P339_RHOML|nr:hypothetical protein RHMOL_Rhmol04G0217400 [Rhododendron molle]